MNWQPGISLEEIEREVIITALRFYQWNRTRTADALKLSVRTIQNKISQYVDEGYLEKIQQEPFKVELPEEVEPEPDPYMKRQMDASRKKLVLRDRRES